MAEYTEEQLESIIKEKLTEATKGLFTEDELNKRVNTEVDRRVESGIQKGLDTYKSKWQKELEEKANLTAEELARKQLEEKTTLLTQKEKEIAKKANTIDAKDLLSDAGIPKAHYEKVLGMLISDDSELTKTNVQSFIDVFNSTKSEIETKIKSELSNVKPPENGDNKAITKEDFNKMGYADKLAFKQKYPELYKEFVK